MGVVKVLGEKHGAQRSSDFVFRLLFIGCHTPYELQLLTFVAANDSMGISYVYRK